MTTINPNAFGDAGTEPAPPQLRLWVRDIPTIAGELVDRLAMGKPGLMLELRESFHDHSESCPDPSDLTASYNQLTPQALAHRVAGEEVWEAFARKLGLPELPGGGYR